MGHLLTRARPGSPGHRARQAGIVLFIALISLVVMSLGAIAMIRAVDASGTIAGNLAFRQASTQATHIGVGRAIDTLNQTVDRNLSNPQAGYLAFISNLSTASDVPDRAAWTPVPCHDAAAVNQPEIDCTDASAFRMQTIIERLCMQSPVTDPTTQCVNAPPADDGSKKSGSLRLVTQGQIHYRVTVRVLGPRNAVSLAQAVVAY